LGRLELLAGPALDGAVREVEEHLRGQRAFQQGGEVAQPRVEVAAELVGRGGALREAQAPQVGAEPLQGLEVVQGLPERRRERREEGRPLLVGAAGGAAPQLVELGGDALPLASEALGAGLDHRHPPCGAAIVGDDGLAERRGAVGVAPLGGAHAGEGDGGLEALGADDVAGLEGREVPSQILDGVLERVDAGCECLAFLAAELLQEGRDGAGEEIPEAAEGQVPGRGEGRVGEGAGGALVVRGVAGGIAAEGRSQERQVVGAPQAADLAEGAGPAPGGDEVREIPDGGGAVGVLPLPGAVEERDPGRAPPVPPRPARQRLLERRGDEEGHDPVAEGRDVEVVVAPLVRVLGEVRLQELGDGGGDLPEFFLGLAVGGGDEVDLDPGESAGEEAGFPPDFLDLGGPHEDDPVHLGAVAAHPREQLAEGLGHQGRLLRALAVHLVGHLGVAPLAVALLVAGPKPRDHRHLGGILHRSRRSLCSFAVEIAHRLATFTE
jgi:hypothetical protein